MQASIGEEAILQQHAFNGRFVLVCLSFLVGQSSSLAADWLDVDFDKGAPRLGSGVDMETGEMGKGRPLSRLKVPRVNDRVSRFSLNVGLGEATASTASSNSFSVALSVRYLVAKGQASAYFNNVAQQSSTGINLQMAACAEFDPQTPDDDIDRSLLSTSARQKLDAIAKAKSDNNDVLHDELVNAWRKSYGTHFVSGERRVSRAVLSASFNSLSSDFRSEFGAALSIRASGGAWSGSVSSSMRETLNRELQETTITFTVQSEGAGMWNGSVAPKSLEDMEQIARRQLEQIGADNATVGAVELTAYEEVFPELKPVTIADVSLTAYRGADILARTLGNIRLWLKEDCLLSTAKNRLRQSESRIQRSLEELLEAWKENDALEGEEVEEHTKPLEKLWLPASRPRMITGSGDVLGRGLEPYVVVVLEGWDITQLTVESGKGSTPKVADFVISRSPTPVIEDKIQKASIGLGGDAVWEAWSDMAPNGEVAFGIVTRSGNRLIARGLYKPAY